MAKCRCKRVIEVKGNKLCNRCMDSDAENAARKADREFRSIVGRPAWSEKRKGKAL